MLEWHLAELLEGTTDAAFVVDLEGEVKTWNKAAEALFGYPASYAIGRVCATLIGIPDAPHTAVCRESCDILECVRKGTEVSNFDMEVRNRAGQPLWVNVSVLVASNERTDRRLAVHFMRDIGAKKRANDLTRRILTMARELVSGTEVPNTLPPISPLTPQEKNILGLLSSGKTTAEVVAELQISIRTLRNHIFHINKKLHTASRIEAVIEASKRGLI